MRVRLVAGAGARARGADEHVVLHLLAVFFAVRRLLPDPGAVALDDLAVDRRGPYWPIPDFLSRSSGFSRLAGSLFYPPRSRRRARQQ